MTKRFLVRKMVLLCAVCSLVPSEKVSGFGGAEIINKAAALSPLSLFSGLMVLKYFAEGVYTAVSSYNKTSTFTTSLTQFLVGSSTGALKGFILSQIPQLQAGMMGYDFGKDLAESYFRPKLDVCGNYDWFGWAGCKMGNAGKRIVAKSGVSDGLIETLSYGGAALGFIGAHALWTYLPAGLPLAILTSLDVLQHVKRLERFAGDPKAVKGAVDNVSSWIGNSHFAQYLSDRYKGFWEGAATFLGGASILKALEDTTQSISQVDKRYAVGAAGVGLLLAYYGKKLYGWYKQRNESKKEEEVQSDAGEKAQGGMVVNSLVVIPEEMNKGPLETSRPLENESDLSITVKKEVNEEAPSSLIGQPQIVVNDLYTSKPDVQGKQVDGKDLFMFDMMLDEVETDDEEGDTERRGGKKFPDLSAEHCRGTAHAV